MRVFKKANVSDGWTCLVCGKATDGSVTLVPINETEDGGNVKCLQVHVSCLNLSYLPEYNVFLQIIGDKDEKA